MRWGVTEAIGAAPTTARVVEAALLRPEVFIVTERFRFGLFICSYFVGFLSTI